MGSCIECNAFFEEEEGVQHVCEECGKLQPESGSWAVEQMSEVDRLESEGAHSEAADALLELFYTASDHEYSDWPFSWKVGERLEGLCRTHGLADQHVAFHIAHIRILQRQNGALATENLEKGTEIARRAYRPDLEMELLQAHWNVVNWHDSPNQSLLDRIAGVQEILNLNPRYSGPKE